MLLLAVALVLRAALRLCDVSSIFATAGYFGRPESAPLPATVRLTTASLLQMADQGGR